jgi:hypothetical protein
MVNPVPSGQVLPNELGVTCQPRQAAHHGFRHTCTSWYPSALANEWFRMPTIRSTTPASTSSSPSRIPMTYSGIAKSRVLAEFLAPECRVTTRCYAACCSHCTQEFGTNFRHGSWNSAPDNVLAVAADMTKNWLVAAVAGRVGCGRDRVVMCRVGCPEQEGTLRVSRRGESHPPPLSGPDVTVSRHPAPTVRP